MFSLLDNTRDFSDASHPCFRATRHQEAKDFETQLNSNIHHSTVQVSPAIKPQEEESVRCQSNSRMAVLRRPVLRESFQLPAHIHRSLINIHPHDRLCCPTRLCTYFTDYDGKGDELEDVYVCADRDQPRCFAANMLISVDLVPVHPNLRVCVRRVLSSFLILLLRRFDVCRLEN
ncbi:hypothetical protein F2P81_021692 [Scophthalmus maximus]|uniref:Uncharacterized protein n=1 Tax=Scophthalmus maximus TaxID=52904 RepID=A0A6A4S3Y8_SCOMX|nr:hypothetical protein F2P81_021692 [Scophthalmus maximus]